MRIPEICIISADTRLSRFFALEIESLGARAVEYADLDEFDDTFDLVIFDKDTVSDSLRCVCPVAYVSRDGDAQLSWPESIDRLREVCMTLIGGKVSLADDTQSKETARSVSFESGDFVAVGSIRIKLSKNELRVLRALCEAEGRAVPRERIMELLEAKEGNISDVYICHLRKKLEEPLGRKLIFTQRGQGYRTTLTVKKEF